MIIAKSACDNIPELFHVSGPSSGPHLFLDVEALCQAYSPNLTFCRHSARSKPTQWTARIKLWYGAPQVCA